MVGREQQHSGWRYIDWITPEVEEMNAQKVEINQLGRLLNF